MNSSELCRINAAKIDHINKLFPCVRQSCYILVFVHVGRFLQLLKADKAVIKIMMQQTRVKAVHISLKVFKKSMFQ